MYLVARNRNFFSTYGANITTSPIQHGAFLKHQCKNSFWNSGYDINKVNIFLLKNASSIEWQSMITHSKNWISAWKNIKQDLYLIPYEKKIFNPQWITAINLWYNKCQRKKIEEIIPEVAIDKGFLKKNPETQAIRTTLNKKDYIKQERLLPTKWRATKWRGSWHTVRN